MIDSNKIIKEELVMLYCLVMILISLTAVIIESCSNKLISLIKVS